MTRVTRRSSSETIGARASMRPQEAGHRRVQVERPPVLGRLLVPGELQPHVPERLVLLLPQRHAHEVAHGQRLGLGLLPLGQEPPQAGEDPDRARVLVMPREPGPQCLLVELDLLLGRTADHAA